IHRHSFTPWNVRSTGLATEITETDPWFYLCDLCGLRGYESGGAKLPRRGARRTLFHLLIQSLMNTVFDSLSCHSCAMPLNNIHTTPDPKSRMESGYPTMLRNTAV